MFWDSSALVPLLLPETRSDSLTLLLGQDPEPVIWWATPLECQSALQRRHREHPIPAEPLAAATERLRQLVQHADTIAPTDELRRRAARLLAFHPLRAADALQLAAALVWCEEQPHGEVFVTLDERLREAAGKEGFTTPPAAGA
jgi:predicted nucleic acid-binding protein